MTSASEFPAPSARDFRRGTEIKVLLVKRQRFAFQSKYYLTAHRPKLLGTFSEGRTGMSFLRVAPGAEIKPGTQENAELWFCGDRAFSYDGGSWAPAHTSTCGSAPT